MPSSPMALFHLILIKSGLRKSSMIGWKSAGLHRGSWKICIRRIRFKDYISPTGHLMQILMLTIRLWAENTEQSNTKIKKVTYTRKQLLTGIIHTVMYMNSLMTFLWRLSKMKIHSFWKVLSLMIQEGLFLSLRNIFPAIFHSVSM